MAATLPILGAGTVRAWQLALVQLWVVAFTPLWLLILAFSPLALAPPNPSWPAFLLTILPPGLVIAGSIGLWVAWWKKNVKWMRIISLLLFLLPICALVPMGLP
ncbi:hypothetical protein KUV35_07750 [Marinobacter salsuginis]|uniref:hypothetical protein n=1 Tax=Marinobacter salsuginis TaxID=418719 RepID=UPI001C97FFF4|nr:hypothetical protein [Marinobacter salsuginis]MBY6071183.1 hypothetical protein [Marinobacter salsuginis]